MLILSAVLNTPYAAKPGQSGGTIIAESVREVEEHRRLLESGGYRPEGCPRCGRFLHAHGQRTRKLRDLAGSTTQESIWRYRCRPCRAVWQVLPGFIARHLHRTWDVVQTALAELSSPQRPATRGSTLRRWRGRLASSAVVLIQAMLEVGVPPRPLLDEVGSRCIRSELVDSLARIGLIGEDCRFQDLACWIHRIYPGLRLA